MKIFLYLLVYLVGRSNLIQASRRVRNFFCKPFLYFEKAVRDTPVSKVTYEYQQQQAFVSDWLEDL